MQTKYATTELDFKYSPGTRLTDEGNSLALTIWKQRTTQYLGDYIHSLDSSLGEASLQIESIEQSLVSRRQRRLQANSTATSLTTLTIEFVTKINLPSSYDANSLINGAFATRNRRETYRLRLLLQDGASTYDPQDTLIIFFDGNLQEVVYVTGTDDTPSGDDDQGDDTTPNASGGGSNAGVMVGGALAGVFGLGIGVFFLYKKNKDRKLTSKDTKQLSPLSAGSHNTSNNGQTSSGNNNIHHHHHHYNSAAAMNGISWEPAEQPTRLNQEIVVESMDDVSTIGDPLYGQPTHPSQDTDDRTATASSIMQSDTYNALLGRTRPTLEHGDRSFTSAAEHTEFSAFTGMSKYLLGNGGGGPAGHGVNPQQNSAAGTPKSTLLGELGINNQEPGVDDTSFEQRMFPIEPDIEEERSLDFSYPTALM